MRSKTSARRSWASASFTARTVRRDPDKTGYTHRAHAAGNRSVRMQPGLSPTERHALGQAFSAAGEALSATCALRDGLRGSTTVADFQSAS